MRHSNVGKPTSRATIPLALVARGLSIAAASLPLHLDRPRKSQAVALLTCSGLRGGIAVALALSLPASPYREEPVTAAYGIAIFTMVVQGLSLGRLARWLYPPDEGYSKGSTWGSAGHPT